jgi:hypothetical protein
METTGSNKHRKRNTTPFAGKVLFDKDDRKVLAAVGMEDGGRAERSSVGYRLQGERNYCIIV